MKAIPSSLSCAIFRRVAGCDHIRGFMAGAAITRDTNATAIVLSESDGLVRAFKGGQIILEIDPEEY